MRQGGVNRSGTGVVALVVGLAICAAACGNDALEPSDIEELPDGTYMLYTPCADDVSAVVTESDSEIRIDDVRGEALDGDCLGGLQLDLDAPIGGRVVVVNGDRWVRIDANCDLAVFAPDDVADDGWAVPRPCRSS